jgi:hypothetical protein
MQNGEAGFGKAQSKPTGCFHLPWAQDIPGSDPGTPSKDILLSKEILRGGFLSSRNLIYQLPSLPADGKKTFWHSRGSKLWRISCAKDKGLTRLRTVGLRVLRTPRGSKPIPIPRSSFLPSAIIAGGQDYLRFFLIAAVLRIVTDLLARRACPQRGMLLHRSHMKHRGFDMGSITVPKHNFVRLD